MVKTQLTNKELIAEGRENFTHYQKQLKALKKKLKPLDSGHIESEIDCLIDSLIEAKQAAKTTEGRELLVDILFLDELYNVGKCLEQAGATWVGETMRDICVGIESTVDNLVGIDIKHAHKCRTCRRKL